MGTIVTSIKKFPEEGEVLLKKCPCLTLEDGYGNKAVRTWRHSWTWASPGGCVCDGSSGVLLPPSQMQICSAGCWDGLRLSPTKLGSCFQVDVYEDSDLS